MRILIAEDDATSRTVLTAVLTQEGYDVTATADGEQAWQILRQPAAPQLGILDLMMPKLDGLEVVRRVRALPTQWPPYLIMLTTKSDKVDVIAGLRGHGQHLDAAALERGAPSGIGISAGDDPGRRLAGGAGQTAARRKTQTAVQDDAHWGAPLQTRQPAGQLRVVGQSGAAADHDRVVGRTQMMGALPRFLAGDPAARPGARRDAAIQ